MPQTDDGRTTDKSLILALLTESSRAKKSCILLGMVSTKADASPKIHAYFYGWSVPKLFKELWNLKFWIRWTIFVRFFFSGRGCVWGYHSSQRSIIKFVISWKWLVVERNGAKFGPLGYVFGIWGTFDCQGVKVVSRRRCRKAPSPYHPTVFTASKSIHWFGSY